MFKTHCDADAIPPHPGEILRQDILPCLDMTTAGLARHLAVSEPQLAEFLAERAPLTPDLAGRLGVALGQGARYWLALQAQYDVWLATEQRPEGVEPLAWGRKRRPAPAKTTRAAA